MKAEDLITPVIMLGGLGFLGFMALKSLKAQNEPDIGPQFSGLTNPPPTTATTGNDLPEGDFWEAQGSKAIDTGLNLLSMWATSAVNGDSSSDTGTGFDDVDWDNL